MRDELKRTVYDVKLGGSRYVPKLSEREYAEMRADVYEIFGMDALGYVPNDQAYHLLDYIERYNGSDGWVDFNALNQAMTEIAMVKEEDPNTMFCIVFGGGGKSHPLIDLLGVDKIKSPEEAFARYRSISAVNLAQASLSLDFIEAAGEVGLRPAAYHAETGIMMESGDIKRLYISSVRNALRGGLTPMFFGSAVESEHGYTLCSSDLIATHIARRILEHKDGKYDVKLIMAGDVNGVYTGDPHKNPDAKVIELIDRENINEFERCISGSNKIDTTGGMIHKVEKAMMFSGLTRIISGSKGNIYKTIMEEYPLEPNGDRGTFVSGTENPAEFWPNVFQEHAKPKKFAPSEALRKKI